MKTINPRFKKLMGKKHDKNCIKAYNHQIVQNQVLFKTRFS